MSTPACIQRRRWSVAALNSGTLALAFAVMLRLILIDGVTWSEYLIGLGFVLTLPYSVLGFWNAVIGIALRHMRPKTVRAMPGVAELTATDELPALTTCTALVMTLRNEDPAPVFERLERMRLSLAATGRITPFVFVILSDSDQPRVVAAEAQAFDRFSAGAKAGGTDPIYRRRLCNTGYKAGNISEFLDAGGSAFDYFIPLDADSLMSGEVIVRMVGTMQAHPEIGILQSLVVGMPSASGFTRLFQFGMRHAMRAVTTGAAWWTADCGSYWGHNAVIRVAPFHRYCRLPELSGSPPLGGAVLSHDQVEAAFMRRAGYEVRVVPLETDSYEINPPTLLDFIRRELRWCQGNMQYLRLWRTPGLRAVSRFQLIQAIGMYIAPAAWIGMILATCLGAATHNLSIGSPTLGLMLFLTVFLLAIAPKIIGVVDVMLSAREAARYGGAALFMASAVVELVASILIAPVVAFSITLFLIGLLCGRHITWGGQNRDRLDLAWRDAWLPLAPHMLAAVTMGVILWSMVGTHAAVWALPILAGPALAVPFTVWSSRRTLGARMQRRRLCLVPEEHVMPPVLAARAAGHHVQQTVKNHPRSRSLGRRAVEITTVTARRPALTTNGHSDQAALADIGSEHVVATYSHDDRGTPIL
ncbi:MAG: glucans biosynthesis glucosyltransferase MdoH [Salinisphaera sp.]|jgi:membrane glycosyltransferase|nr:glucans biosynthesis glucosyltransferase MdoH [Salinisphaera sp.]